MHRVRVSVALRGSGVFFGETNLYWNDGQPKKTPDPVAIAMRSTADA
jgi:hypothetical protein